MPLSNIFEAGAVEVPELFRDYLDYTSPERSCAALVLSKTPAASAERNAIEKSLAALGFGERCSAYATLLPIDHDAEGGDIPLDAQSLFLLVEGIDPLRVIAADKSACSLLAEAYRTSIEPDCALRLFGRPSAAFSDLAGLVSTPQGKQRAWALLKTLG